MAGDAIGYAPVLPALPGIEGEPLVWLLQDRVGEEVPLWLLSRGGISRMPRIQAFLDHVLHMAEEVAVALGGTRPAP